MMNLLDNSKIFIELLTALTFLKFMFGGTFASFPKLFRQTVNMKDCKFVIMSLSEASRIILKLLVILIF